MHKRSFWPALSLSPWSALLLALGFSAVLLLPMLIYRMQYELSGATQLDAQLYWAVARGIVNGLLPYTDMFENKPPGIFLLGALSLWLTGGRELAYAVQAAVIGLLPFMCGITAFHRTRDMSLQERASLTLITWMLSALVTIGLAVVSGKFQTESFGAFFITLYACCVAWDERPMGAWRIVVASLALLAGIGFKEPFFLIAIAVAMLFLRSKQQIIRSFVAPLFIAAVTGLIALAVLGYLEGYLSMYLNDTLTTRVSVRTLGYYYSIHQEMARLAGAPTGAALLVIGGITAVFAARGKPLGKACIAAGLIFLSLWIAVRTNHISKQYWPHHRVFAAPVFIGLVLLFVQTLAREREKFLSTIAIVIIGAMTVNAALLARVRNRTVPPTRYTEYLLQAQTIDGILDRCGLDRYAYIGPHAPGLPYSFTTHSPYGPAFIQYSNWVEDKSFVKESLIATLTKAQLVVHFQNPDKPEGMSDAIDAFLAENFSLKPWQCAGSVREIARHTVYYRKPGRESVAFIWHE